MKMKLILCCVLALALGASGSAAMPLGQSGAVITVDTSSDVISGDGYCSLREAIVAANTDNPFQDCPGGNGDDHIVFSPGLPQPAILTLSIAGTGEDSALTGDLDLAGNLTIEATDPIVVDGDGLDRIFEVLPGAHVTISGLTMRHGNPGAGADGGGVAVDLTAVLTLTHSTVISNTALRGGGIKVLGRLTLENATVDGNQGGGISNDGGLLTLANVQICDNIGQGIRSENTAALTFTGGLVCRNQGGGIYTNSSVATMYNVTIMSNTGSGGVFNTGAGTQAAKLTISACTVISNTATNGGGILSEGIGAQASIFNTDIAANTATSAGGGVHNNGLMTLNGSTVRDNQARSGGGIDHIGGNLYMTNDTVSGNNAGDNGGGLYNRSSAILTNVTFNGNTAAGPDTGGNIFNDTALLSIVNSIVAHSPADGNCFNSEGSIQSLGHNLDSGNTCGFGATGDITNTNPLLGPLQDNGGHTLTHALLPGSPAIDEGDPASYPATDQRGVARPQGIACDIGAYEFGDMVADLSIGKQRQGTGTVAAGGRITYTLTVTNVGPGAPVTAAVVDTWSPITAVVDVDAPGCAVDLGGGVITCTRPALGLGASFVPDPYLVFTTSATFSGTLTNVATVTTTTGVADANTANNASEPIVVTITKDYRYRVYLPLVSNGAVPADNATAGTKHLLRQVLQHDNTF